MKTKPFADVFDGLNIGFALTGSFCTFDKAFNVAEQLIEMGARIIPIMSENAATTDTRFGKAADNIKTFEKISGKKVIKTILQAEPIGPAKMCDVMVVAPCTGNTMAKLAGAITDTPVTMAVKSHIRNLRPVLICLATNDALAGSSRNISSLLAAKNYFLVPFAQDDPTEKPTSAIGDFSLIPQAIAAALEGKQLQPIIK